MASPYAQSIEYLFSLEQHGIKLGLENIKILCSELGHPELSFTSIIVAGTNGKGSVSAMLDTALQSAGYKTGRYTSPHLVHLEERFVISGHPVSKEVLELEATHIRQTIEKLLTTKKLSSPPTFFEATTAIAFSLFCQAAVRIAVLEVGMGGRFDATNIVKPTAAAITSIDLDHEQYLGSTLEKIAFEKAGIVKPETLVVVGETKPQALEILRTTCRECKAKLIEPINETRTQFNISNDKTNLEIRTPVRHYGPLKLSLQGQHQVRNTVVTVRLLEELSTRGFPVNKEAIIKGLTKTRWPGRLELIRIDDRRSLLLDIAHNVAAIEALSLYLTEVYPQGIPLVFAVSRDKDVVGMISALEKSITRVVCAPLKNRRAWTSEGLAAKLNEARPELCIDIARSPIAALDTAWKYGNVICAAGSIYLIGEIIEAISSNELNICTQA